MADDKHNTPALIPLASNTIGHESIQTVNGRDLYTFLEVDTPYSMWIIRRIKTYGFLQDIDFCVHTFVNGPTKTIEYYLSLDMAKELAMVERTAKGREARRYFIACEHALTARQLDTQLPEEIVMRKLAAWQNIGAFFKAPEHIVQQEAVKRIEASTGVDLRFLLKVAPAQDIIQEEDIMLEPTDLAKRLGISSGRAMNMLLEQIGWQCKIGENWEPTAQGKPYAKLHAWHSNYGTKTGYNLKWQLTSVQKMLRQVGLIP